MLHFLWILFLLWIVVGVLYVAARAVMAFGRALDRRLNPPAPRDLERERQERLKHEAHMGR
jgi:hypothetical protein